MPVSPGTRLGEYEVLALLGSGGMGEIWRARDAKLGRDVALKVLPAEVASDDGRLRRFEQEARAASSLNHPNIVTIHDIGTSGTTAYIAMELVEGRTLREMLFSGPLAARRILEIGAQAADGIAKAHGAGIVHRDLKPENLMVTKDGFVKILDFGLAKLSGTGSGDFTHLSTVVQETKPGTVLGTVGYMSPEQASGQPVDFRSDQFSLGSILYEMATGERAFQRPTAAQTMAAIIQDEPEPIAKRNAKVPAPLRWIVERCLSKEPDHRYASTRDLAKELATLRDHLSEAVSTAEIPAAAPRGRTGRLAAVALALAASWAGVYLAATRAATRPVPTLKRLTFRRGSISPGAARFAPDEKTIVYSAEWDGAPSEVFTTRIDGPESRPLGLPGAGLISVSSRGELAIGQGDPSTLATVSLGGGAPRPLLENVDSADWGPDGRLAVVRDGNRLEYPPGKVLYRSSRLLSPVRVSPRGDRVAVIEHAPVFADAVLLVVDAGGRSRRLAAARCMMGLAWSPRGDEIWFSAGENLAVNPHAVTLDGKERRVAALPDMAIVDDVSPTGRVLVAHVSARSQIAGLFPGQTVERDLTWLDASGVTDISADGKTILFGENGEGGGSERSVYVRRTDGSIPVRLGSGSAFALSPDGKLVFSRAWPNGGNQAVLLPTGPGEPKPLVLAALERARQMAWFPDGRRFVVSGNEKGRPERCWVVDVSEGKPRPLGPEGLTDPVAVSPDGTRLLARDVRGTAAASHPFAVYTIEGGAIRVLAGTGELDGPLRWGPEGRSFLAFHSIGDRKTQIVRVDAETGTQQVIRELVPADPAGQFGAPDPVVTPDGRYYAYNLVRFLADLYVVDGVR